MNIIENGPIPENSYPVRVYRETGPIPDTMKWWDAEIAGLLVQEWVYYVPMIDGYPSREHVRLIHKEHPNHTLVYIGESCA